MKVLLDYKDIMSLGFSKKMAYDMIDKVRSTDEYKKSNLCSVIKTKKVTGKMFVKVFPELKEGVNELCKWNKWGQFMEKKAKA